MKVTTIGQAIAVGFATALAVTLAAPPALADPPAGDYRVFAGVGSDTTQEPLNGFGEVVLSGGNKVIASYDATGTATIKTRAAGCQFNRPNGSGNGRLALRASQGEDLGGTHGGPGFWQGVDVRGCIDFARSSSFAATPNYTFFAWGVDALALAINSGGDLPSNMSFAQVQRVYKCFSTTIAGNPVVPRHVQPGSGTWEFWMSRMGITQAEINLGDYGCLAQDTDGNPATPAVPVHPYVQEHDGRPLEGNLSHVLPFSAAGFIAQTNRASILALTGVNVEDRRGPARLTGMSTTTQPVTQPIVGGVLNVNFPQRRDVYNVVPNASLSNPLVTATFSGAGAAMCTATVNDGGTQRFVSELFGFGRRTTHIDASNAACGFGRT
jgi:hypothetical protein